MKITKGACSSPMSMGQTNFPPSHDIWLHGRRLHQSF